MARNVLGGIGISVSTALVTDHKEIRQGHVINITGCCAACGREGLAKRRGGANNLLQKVTTRPGLSARIQRRILHLRLHCPQAVFDALARAGGIRQLSEAAAKEPPEEGLAMLVRVFRIFWSSDTAIGRVYAAIASDPAIKTALAPRLSLGRVSIKQLVDRLVPYWTTQRREDVADLIEVLTDYPSVSRLSESRIPTEVDAAMLAACQSILAG